VSIEPNREFCDIYHIFVDAIESRTRRPSDRGIDAVDDGCDRSRSSARRPSSVRARALDEDGRHS